MSIVFSLFACFVVAARITTALELERYSFDNQIDGAIPPSDPFPLSAADLNNAAPLSFVVGQSGNAGNADGAADAPTTTVAAPTFVWGDSVGNVYFSVPLNHVIRKVAAEGNTVSIFAGTGIAGYSEDGTATSVQLNKPHGLFGDSNRLVFCDTLNARIREVSLATNALTNLAGSGLETSLRGYDGDGDVALSSKLFSPFSVWIDVKDNKGDVYFTELHKCTIRKIDGSTQIITTIVGVAGQCGFNGYSGPGVSTHLSRPYALFGDGEAGLLLVADFNNNLVRQYDMASGQISTIAGQGEANKNSLLDRGNGGAAVESVILRPTGVWRDSEGNVYIAESFSSVVRKIDASTGLISTAVGVLGIKGPFTKVGSNALYHPRGIWGDESSAGIGKIFVPDTGNHRIVSRSFTPLPYAAATRISFIGTGSAGFSGDGYKAMDAQISSPQRVWQDSLGNVYFSSNSNVIRKVNVYGYISSFVNVGVTYAPLFGDSNFLYVCAAGSLLAVSLSDASITTIAGGGSVIPIAGQTTPALSALLSSIAGVWVDNAGDKYIAGAAQKKIFKLSAEDNSITVVTSFSDNGLSGIFGDNQGHVFFSVERRIYQIDLATNGLTVLLGNGAVDFTSDGNVASSSKPVYRVKGLALDSDGNIYFSEYAQGGYGLVRRIGATDRVIRTVAGRRVSAAFADSSSAFGGSLSGTLAGIVWANDGSLLICEGFRHTIHRVYYPST